MSSGYLSSVLNFEIIIETISCISSSKPMDYETSLYFSSKTDLNVLFFKMTLENMKMETFS
jgi:hypothetical protein